MKFKFYVERSRLTGMDRLGITVKDALSRSVVQPLQFKVLEPGAIISEAEAYAISGGYDEDNVRDFLQAAADCAWDEGVRPSQSRDMTNEVAAVRYHLEDMRRLAFPATGGAK